MKLVRFALLQLWSNIIGNVFFPFSGYRMEYMLFYVCFVLAILFSYIIFEFSFFDLKSIPAANPLIRGQSRPNNMSCACDMAACKPSHTLSQNCLTQSCSPLCNRAVITGHWFDEDPVDKYNLSNAVSVPYKSDEVLQTCQGIIRNLG